jgi:hypothetical protein
MGRPPWEFRRKRAISWAHEFRRLALQIPGTDIKVKLRECSPVEAVSTGKRPPP